MNLICITESELAQWVSRKHFDTLIARVLTEQIEVTCDIFSTAPFLKLDDARGRVVVNLKDGWKNLSSNACVAKNFEVVSIPVEAIKEIAPTMDQYAKRLATYALPIATWSIEKIWDKWLITQAVSENYRAAIHELKKIGCIDKEISQNEIFLKSLIEKSFRPDKVSSNESILMGWDKVLAHRDDWIQALRIEGHLENTSMLNASVKLIVNSLLGKNDWANLQIIDEERGWEFQDISAENLQQFSALDSEITKNQSTQYPPLFCVATYLRLYDEIHNGNKDWRTFFNLIRFTKYSVNSIHSDIALFSLIASLKTEEIYSLGLRDLYML